MFNSKEDPVEMTVNLEDDKEVNVVPDGYENGNLLVSPRIEELANKFESGVFGEENSFRAKMLLYPDYDDVIAEVQRRRTL